MSNYICLADILSSGGGIEVDVALVGDVSTSEIRYYREGDESNVVSPNSAQVYLSKYGTYYFYLTNGDRTSGKVKVEATQAMLYSISLGYFSTTVNITCTGPESGADITLSGPNSWSKTVTATSTSTSFTVPYAGTYTAKATYNGVSSNAVTVEVSTKGATYTGTVKFIRLSISVDSGSAVVLTDSSGTTIKSYTQGSNAELVYLSALGTYTASASLSGETTSGSVNCSAYGDFTLALAYRALDQTMLSTIASAVSAGNLNNVSWSTLSSISDALESDKCTDDDIIEAKKLLKLYKTVAYSSTTTVYCHIIGVLQDHLGSEKRGFTMWVTATDTPLSTSSKALHITSSAINTSSTNSGGWGDSNVVRPALQSGGEIYKRFDTSLTDVIKSKTTYYGANYNSTSSAVADIEDKMFLLSGYEMYGCSYSTSYGYYANEGTGASHNEQYQLFANEGITPSDCSKLSCSSGCWSRSVHYVNSNSFLLVYNDGSLYNHGSYYANGSRGCCPAFCI